MTTAGCVAEAVGAAGNKQPRGKHHVPSYMQPTRSSKLKENLYGTEFKFTPKKSVFAEVHSPPEHGLDYVPPRPLSPGVPRFMKPTRTSKRKMAEAPKHNPMPRSPFLTSAGGTKGFSSIYNTGDNLLNRHNINPLPSRVSQNFPERKEKRQTSSVYLSWREEIAKEQRKRSYSHMTPNPAIIGYSLEEPPALSMKSVAMADHKKSLIQTAPAPDSYREESLDSHFSSADPSTPSVETPRRQKRLPRYMMPTTASAARIKQ